MPISEALVTEVVTETSARMTDPDYVQLAVGGFVQAQPHISRYLSAKATRLGGAQSVVHVVFHAELMSECIRRALGREPPVVDLRTLDRASQGDLIKRFTEREPALASYVASNVDEAPLRTELCRIGLALALASE